MERVRRPSGLAFDREAPAERVRGLAGGRAAILAVLLGTAVLYVWGLDRSGWANSYYSAAVLAGTQSWKAFFYGAFDAGSFITVDKPPASLWLMALSARLFGLSSWSILLPEALLGVATVALVYATVRRQLGAAAGLVAAVVMALTPVAVLMFRFNNPDALLTFLLAASAWALVRAMDGGRTWWLVLSAAIVGLAFDTKYLQAYIVLPALVLTFLLLGPGSWGRRFLQLLAAGGALVVSTGWWMAIVSLVPAAARPFIGGSTNNSVLDLVLGYDGFGRLTGVLGGRGGGPPSGGGDIGGGGIGGGGGFGGAAGPLRLFNEQLGGDISWLLPLAGVAIVVGIWSRWGRPRTDPARAAYVLWGLWLLTHAVVFSFASGILHAYYTVAMAPAVAALVGGGAVELWRLRGRWFPGGLIAAGALVLTAWWGSRLLARTPDFAPGLGTIELVLAVLAALALLLPRWRRLPVRVPSAALAVGLVAVMLGPASYAVATVGQAQNSPDPSAGPAGAARALGGPGGFGGARERFAGGPPQGFAGAPPDGFAGGPPQERAGPPAGGGFGGRTDTALIAYLVQHQGSATWLVATDSANTAAPISLATGRPVLAMGGFSGGDPAMTVDHLRQLVASGQLRYVLAQGRGGAGPGGGGGTAASVTEWVTANCASVGSVSGGLYDCATPAGGSVT
jgi:4-amino-4-deoxy-L-arabinose transferase-like glycosyltransferase